MAFSASTATANPTGAGLSRSASDADPAAWAAESGTPRVRLALTGVEAIPELRHRLAAWAIAAVGRELPELELVASELLTNAALHGELPAVAFARARRDGSVVVVVLDASREMPTERTPGPDEIGGHGMRICRALCESIHVHRVPGGGKAVRAVVNASHPPLQGPAC